MTYIVTWLGGFLFDLALLLSRDLLELHQLLQLFALLDHRDVLQVLSHVRHVLNGLSCGLELEVLPHGHVLSQFLLIFLLGQQNVLLEEGFVLDHGLQCDLHDRVAFHIFKHGLQQISLVAH